MGAKSLEKAMEVQTEYLQVLVRGFRRRGDQARRALCRSRQGSLQAVRKRLRSYAFNQTNANGGLKCTIAASEARRCSVCTRRRLSGAHDIFSVRRSALDRATRSRRRSCARLCSIRADAKGDVFERVSRSLVGRRHVQRIVIGNELLLQLAQEFCAACGVDHGRSPRDIPRPNAQPIAESPVGTNRVKAGCPQRAVENDQLAVGSIATIAELPDCAGLARPR